MSDITQFDYKDHWIEKEISLQRTNSAHESLGFTIAGGIDLPFMNHRFTSIIITNITENGLAYRNKQFKLYDIILRVNNFDFTNIKHQKAVDILRTSGHKIQLLIRRLAPSYSEEIELTHNGKLNIYIDGGIGNEYFINDHGIFITDISKYQTNKQLDIGDRLLQISSTSNTYDLRFVTFAYAKKYIQLACIESQTIKLYVGHARRTERTVLHQEQYDPFGSNDEKHVQVNKNDYATALYKSQSMASEPSHEYHVPINTMHNEEELIMSFDFDDYQRYENHSRSRNNRSIGFLAKEESQANPIKSAMIQPKINRQANQKSQSLKVNNTDPNAGINQKIAEELKRKQAVIRDAHEERIRRQQSRMGQIARINSGGTGGALRWQVN
ncbi:unnamed protein product [Adineta steineri]|uniref:PDZ domain-containing protein n=2 Tax=Adineta steineri TaxID=433720 RepID=A0A819CL71_9BILA|nr:unnamed protein product [Adineta steineri]